MKIYLYDNETNPTIAYKVFWWLRIIPLSIIVLGVSVAMIVFLVIMMMIGIGNYILNPSNINDNGVNSSNQEQCVPDPWGAC